MPHGKLVRIKEIPMGKDEHPPEVQQVIQRITPSILPKRKHCLAERIRIRPNIRIRPGATVNRKLLKDLPRPDHRPINTIMRLNHRMDQQAIRSPIKQQRATIISRLIRHLRPITVADGRRAHRNSVQFFVFVFPRLFFSFVRFRSPTFSSLLL